MNKATVIALFLAGLVVATLGVMFAKQSSESASEEPLFIG
jgi:hypothetical protein